MKWSCGGIDVQPDAVAHLVDQPRVRRQFERLNPVRLQPEARQMRPIVAWLSPVVRAMARVLQCVAPRGVDSRVRTTTSSDALFP